MQQRNVANQQQIAEFEQHIAEEDKLLLEANTEILHQKVKNTICFYSMSYLCGYSLQMLRLEQLKRNRKVFKPVQKRGMWRAFQEKIDLTEKKSKLRATASPFLRGIFFLSFSYLYSLHPFQPRQRSMSAHRAYEDRRCVTIIILYLCVTYRNVHYKQHYCVHPLS